LLRRGSDPRLDNFARQRVPAGHVFVLGDNRGNSMDSRFVGPVKVEDIHWRAGFVFWSHDLDRVGLDLRTSR
jgi:signal peptidase I